MNNPVLKLIPLMICLIFLPLVIEAQTLPEWVENPPRDTEDTIYILMKGMGKTLQDAKANSSRGIETSTGYSSLTSQEFQYDFSFAGNVFFVDMTWEDWFSDNAKLVEDTHISNGEGIIYYAIYSMPKTVYNELWELLYWYVPALKEGNIENAIYLASIQLVQEMPKNKKVAVISFASADKDLGEFVLEEITGYLSSSGTMSLFDRKSLDSIRRERDFQMTGDVDDKTAVSIGEYAGADVVITGSTTGSGSTRRLRFKALDVKTGAILSQTSHRY